MDTQTASNHGKYIYAIVRSEGEQDYGIRGIEDNPVHSITSGSVSAVVSYFSQKKIRAERRHLGAHRKILARLMDKMTLLPLRFGTIAENAVEVRQFLSLNQEQLIAQLDQVAGKVEMGLRVTWDVPDIFEYFFNRKPELRQLRDRYFGEGQPSREEMIEIGRFFDRLLRSEREACVSRVEEVIAGCCAKIKTNPCRNEREVMNLACLVDRSANSAFEAAVTQAANLFDNDFRFDYSGPWAPHNFAELNLEL